MDEMAPPKASDAKLVAGIWLPGSEEHFVDMLTRDQSRLIRDGIGTYQIRKLDRAMTLVPADRRRVAVDIGAHVGLWSMWLVKYFQLVEAFEPVPLHAELFRKNVHGSYTLHEFALGEQPGTMDIEVPYEQTAGAHAALGRPHPGAKYVRHQTWWYKVPSVSVRRLDDLALNDVDFLKIDVEGWELPIMRGAESTLLRCKPVLVVEQKGNELPYGHEKDAAGRYLESLGFECVEVMSGDWIMRWKA